jgi:hypothetical protein
LMITTALNRPDPLREAIVQQKFRFVWNTLWHGNVQQLDQDMDTKSFNNDDQVEWVFFFFNFIIYFNKDSLCSRFQMNMILTENDRKYFSLTYNYSTNDSSSIKFIKWIRKSSISYWNIKCNSMSSLTCYTW